MERGINICRGLRAMERSSLTDVWFRNRRTQSICLVHISLQGDRHGTGDLTVSGNIFELLSLC